MEIAILVFFLAFGFAAVGLILLVWFLWRRARKSVAKRSFSASPGSGAGAIHSSTDYDDYAAETYLADEDYQNERIEESYDASAGAAGSTGAGPDDAAWKSEAAGASWSYESSASSDYGSSSDSSSSSSDSGSSSSDSGSSSSSD